MRLDFELGVGELTEAVTVTGRAELLQTQSADIGNVVDERQLRDLPLLGRRYSELAFLAPGCRRRAGRHHQPRRGHVLQRQRQLRHLEQLHARRRRQQLVLDQPAGAQPAGGAAAGRRAAGVQGADAHLLGRVRQGRRRGDQRLDQAGHQRLPRLGLRVLPRRGLQRQHLGQQPRQPAQGRVQPAHRRLHAGRPGDARPHLLLRRLPGHPHRPGAVADRHRADDADAHRRPERADRGRRRRQPVRAGRLLERHHPARRRVVHRPGGRRASSSSTPQPNVPGDGFFNNNFISNGILNNDINQFDVRLDHHLGSRPRQPLRALQLPADRSGRAADAERPGGLGRLRQRLPDPRPERRRRLVAHLRIEASSASSASPTTASAPTPCTRRSASTRTREYGIIGVPKDPRFYGGLPHMPIARFARLGGPFFRPQYQTSQVFQFAENLTWTKGTPRDEVRRRAAARPGDLHRPALAERRAVVQRRPLHRARPRRLPARAVERAAPDALPRAGPLRRRLAVLRAGQLARARQPDGERSASATSASRRSSIATTC